MQHVIDIKVQSFSDIITNSSSEIFSIRTKNTKDEIESLISTIHKGFLYKGDWNDYYNLEKEERAKYDHFSGDGGRIDVENFDDRYKEFLEYFIPEDKKELFTKEIYSLLEEGSTEEIFSLAYDTTLSDLKRSIWVSINEEDISKIKNKIKILEICNL